jgi:hypothetical protein
MIRCLNAWVGNMVGKPFVVATHLWGAFEERLEPRISETETPVNFSGGTFP